LDDYACSEEWKCPNTPVDHMAKDGDIIWEEGATVSISYLLRRVQQLCDETSLFCINSLVFTPGSILSMLTGPGLGPFCYLHRLISLYLHSSLLGTSILQEHRIIKLPD
jgi:hypothetical protein